jgi:hypothetical protein
MFWVDVKSHEYQHFETQEKKKKKKEKNGNKGPF